MSNFTKKTKGESSTDSEDTHKVKQLLQDYHSLNTPVGRLDDRTLP